MGCDGQKGRFSGDCREIRDRSCDCQTDQEQRRCGDGRYPYLSVRYAGRPAFAMASEGYGHGGGILSEKTARRARIRIIGDYDIDGVSATYILLKGLKRLGADVDTYIPDRVKDGYGIHRQLIEQAKRTMWIPS